MKHFSELTREERRGAAAQVLGRMDAYADEIHGQEFNDLDLHQQIDVIETLMYTGVISKSDVTYM